MQLISFIFFKRVDLASSWEHFADDISISGANYSTLGKLDS